jgi:hypothetical protein
VRRGSLATLARGAVASCKRRHCSPSRRRSSWERSDGADSLQRSSVLKRNSSEGSACTPDSIPVAKTPPGGFQEMFPPPVLAACTEPLVDGAPDLRGLWKVIRVERAGQVLPETPPRQRT